MGDRGTNNVIMRLDDSHDIAVLIRESGEGKPGASEALEQVLYDRMSTEVTRHEPGFDQTRDLAVSSATRSALRPIQRLHVDDFRHRTRLMLSTSRALRRLLVDHARLCDDGRETHVESNVVSRVNQATTGTVHMDARTVGPLLELDAALQSLEKINPRWADVMQCIFFGRMNVAETAAALKIAPTTVKKDWILLRVWLHDQIQGRISVANTDSLSP